jgi:hypothetical protein
MKHNQKALLSQLNESKSKSKLWIKSGVNDKDKEGGSGQKSTPLVFGSVYSDK